MGYHHYYASILGVQKPGQRLRKNALAFDLSNNQLETYPCLFTADTPKNTIFSSFCREILISEMDNVFDQCFEDEKFRFLLGLRCFGNTHSAVGYKMLEYKNYNEILFKFFRKAFGAEIETEVVNGFTEYNSFNYPVNIFTEYDRKVIKTDACVTFYMRYNEEKVKKFDVNFVSMICFLFRERSIIGDILAGKITDRKGLTLALIELARKRKHREFSDYPSYGVANFYSWTSKESIDAQIANYLVDADNDDASDFLSVALTALYVYGFSHLGMENCSGPSSVVGNNYNEKAGEEFVRDFDDKTRALLWSIISDNYYEDDLQYEYEHGGAGGLYLIMKGAL